MVKAIVIVTVRIVIVIMTVAMMMVFIERIRISIVMTITVIFITRDSNMSLEQASMCVGLVQGMPRSMIRITIKSLFMELTSLLEIRFSAVMDV